MAATRKKKSVAEEKVNLDSANDIKKLVDEVNKISHKAFGEEKVLIGRVYEYFLKEFAVNATKEEGEYYTPHDVVSVGIAEIEKNGWSLVPGKYIEFIDHDLEIDYEKEMGRIQKEMRDVLAKERESQKMLEDAFKGIGFKL